MFLQVGNRFFVDYSLSISCLVLNSAKINKKLKGKKIKWQKSEKVDEWTSEKVDK